MLTLLATKIFNNYMYYKSILLIIHDWRYVRHASLPYFGMKNGLQTPLSSAETDDTSITDICSTTLLHY